MTVNVVCGLAFEWFPIIIHILKWKFTDEAKFFFYFLLLYMFFVSVNLLLWWLYFLGFSNHLLVVCEHIFYYFLISNDDKHNRRHQVECIESNCLFCHALNSDFGCQIALIGFYFVIFFSCHSFSLQIFLVLFRYFVSIVLWKYAFTLSHTNRGRSMAIAIEYIFQNEYAISEKKNKLNRKVHDSN